MMIRIVQRPSWSAPAGGRQVSSKQCAVYKYGDRWLLLSGYGGVAPLIQHNQLEAAVMLTSTSNAGFLG